MTLPLRVEQIDLHAFEQDFADRRSRSLAARRRGRGRAIEPGSSSPKLYSMPVWPQLIMIWLILSPGGETSATPPRLPGVSLPSSQPAG